MDFLSRLQHYIDRHSLLKKDGKHIVALSGGADSTALLLSLCQLGYDVEAAHCNFHLRGEESNRDEEFSKELCDKLGVPFHIIHFDTMSYADLHQVSIEMAARQLRYSYFAQLSRDIGADAVCVAHHLDDQVETVLLNLLRGTGLQGMKGMVPSRALSDEMGKNGAVRLVRPLLCMSRKEIEDYLSDENQPFVTDSTNLINDVKRNKLRLDVVPLLKQVNASATEHIAQLADYVAGLLPLIDEATERWLKQARVNVGEGSEAAYDIKTILSSPSPEHLVHSLLSCRGFSAKQTADVYDAIRENVTGKVFYSDTHEMTVDRGMIVFYNREVPIRQMRMPELGRYRISDSMVVSMKQASKDEISFPLKSKNEIMVDMNRLRFPLTIRPTSEGDRFVPFGMNGHRLVSDFLTDQKVNVIAKRRQLVVEDADGNIVWIVGRRADNRYRVTDESRDIVELKMLEERL